LSSHPLPEDWVYTLAGLIGKGPAATGLQVLLALTALAAAARNRHQPALVFAAGLIGSALAAPYWHVQDFLAVSAATGFLIQKGGAGPVPTVAAVATFVAANPLWVGALYKPAWLEVGLWL